ncbi:hypothetical protein F511_47142 [Dorcoceras hygrometricum]|uniref:Uncharacterized protein n=1 Tax=Dorcoceras hygrometricum TaxID=472368 RepID=A0A2Z6ZYE3_9LAMI|nr:hypothetical protein F511_47142 [Dorcoceras hygrometricum]
MLRFNLSKRRRVAPTTGSSNQQLVIQLGKFLTTQQLIVLQFNSQQPKRLTNTCHVLINPRTATAPQLPADTSSNATSEKINDDASLTRYSRNLKCATTDFLILALRLVLRNDSVLLLRHQQLITDFINSRNC